MTNEIEAVRERNKRWLEAKPHYIELTGDKDRDTLLRALDEQEDAFGQLQKQTIEDAEEIGRLQRALDDEIHDIAMVSQEVSRVYDYLTNGRISKPNTKAEAVLAVIEEVQNKVIQEETADMRHALDEANEKHGWLQAELDAFKRRLDGELEENAQLKAQVAKGKKLLDDAELLLNESEEALKLAQARVEELEEQLKGAIIQGRKGE